MRKNTVFSPRVSFQFLSKSSRQYEKSVYAIREKSAIVNVTVKLFSLWFSVIDLL